MEAVQINEEMADKHGLRPFDVAEFLTDEETIQAYLAEVLKEGDQDEFLEALNDIARAREEWRNLRSKQG